MFGLKTIRKLKVIKRLSYILLIFFQAGFGALIYRFGFKKHIPLHHRISAKKHSEQELPIKLRKALEKLGPVFVKFGQILSTRSDLLPPEYIRELEKLQAAVPPFSHQKAREIVEENFGRSVDQTFKQFEKKPFASASLGQVYKAQLKTGETVAVKVQRPGAKEQIKIDTEVLLTLAHLAEKYFPEAKNYNLLEIVQEFRRWTLNELDYRKEATNCEIFSNFFKDDPHIFGPKVYWEYSGDSVLTLEFADGISLKEVVQAKGKNKVDKKLIAHRIADSFIKQCFDYGFFHADPHPGNIFVIKNGRLLFLDFGMVGFLDNRLTSIGSSMFLALIQKDIEMITRLMLQVEKDYDEKADQQDMRQIVKINAFRKDLNQLVLQWSTTGQDGQFTKLFYDLMNIAVKNGFGVPVDLMMLSKAVLTLDVVIKELDPKFRMEKWERPMVEKILSKKLSPKNVSSGLQSAAVVMEDILKKLPDSTATIISNLEKTHLSSGLSAEQLFEYEQLLNAKSVFSTYGTIAAAIIIASALMYEVASQPMIFGKTLSEWGLYLGLFLIIMLLISNKKKG